MAGELNAYAVQPNDNTDDPNGPFSELVVGGAGSLTVVTVGGSTVTLAAVAGQRIFLHVRRIKAMGLTASGIVGQV
jgi:hypothetical protein